MFEFSYLKKILTSTMQELELLEFDGELTSVMQQQLAGVRTDKIAWKGSHEIDREKNKNLQKMMMKMISLPFEINKKCNLYLQGTGTFQLGYFSAQQGFYKKHLDGGYDDYDNGRKITCIFYPGNGEKVPKVAAKTSSSASSDGSVAKKSPADEPSSETKAESADSKKLLGGTDDKEKTASKETTTEVQEIFIPTPDPPTKFDDKSKSGFLRMYKRRDNPFECKAKEIEYNRIPQRKCDKTKKIVPIEDEIVADVEPRPNRLVIFRSRDMPHEVLCNFVKKRFAVSMYIPGPCGPGDMPDGGHTRR